jgi:hypothetical protein
MTYPDEAALHGAVCDELDRLHDEHLNRAHGPILTRGDLEAAEAECSARCRAAAKAERPEGWADAEALGLNPHCHCCRTYAHGHNDRPCVVCGHYTNPGPGNAEPVAAWDGSPDSHPGARAAFTDGLAELFSEAIRAGVTEDELRADFEGCLSVQAFGGVSS